MGKLPDAAGIFAFLIFNLDILNWSNSVPQEICVHLRLNILNYRLWSLEFGIFLELGAWSLELFWSLELGAWSL